MPISRVRSATATSMMFMITIAPTTSPMAGRTMAAITRYFLDRLPRGKRCLGSIQGEIVGLARMQLAPDPHDLAHLLLGIGQDPIVGRLNDDRVDDTAVAVEEPVHWGAVRRDDETCRARSQRAALFLRDAHDFVRHARHADRAAHRINGGEEMVLDVLANDDDQRARFQTPGSLNSRPLTTPSDLIVK